MDAYGQPGCRLMHGRGVRKAQMNLTEAPSVRFIFFRGGVSSPFKSKRKIACRVSFCVRLCYAEDSVKSAPDAIRLRDGTLLGEHRMLRKRSGEGEIK